MLLLVQDSLELYEHQDKHIVLVTLEKMFHELRCLWSDLPDSSMVVLATVSARLTHILAIIFNTYPDSITTQHRNAFLEQTMRLVDMASKDRYHLPGHTVHALVDWVCILLTKANVTEVLWVVKTFSTPTQVVQEVEVEQGLPFMDARARIVTHLPQRPLSHI